MASNYFQNDGRYFLSNPTPPTLYQSLPNGGYPGQHTSSSPTMNATSDGLVAGQDLHSVHSGQSYDYGHMPTRTDSPCPRYSHDMVPDEQAPYGPQSFAPSGFDNEVTNLRQPFDPRTGEGISTYATQQHAQYNVSGYSSTGYTVFNSSSFQPTVPSTRPEAICNTADSYMTNAKPHSCPVCGNPFARKGDMKRHARKHGPSSLRCDVCHSGFYRKDKLKEHRKQHEM